MIILNYSLPIENLEALYRSVNSLDKIFFKKRKEFQFNYIVSIPKPQMFRIFPEPSFIITV